MINLLNILSSVVIGTSAAVTGIAVTSQKTEEKTEKKEFYWNDNHLNEIVKAQIRSDDTDTVIVKQGFTFNLGQTKSFTSFSFAGYSGFYLSWGRNTYNWKTGSYAISFDS